MARSRSRDSVAWLGLVVVLCVGTASVWGSPRPLVDSSMTTSSSPPARGPASWRVRGQMEVLVDAVVLERVDRQRLLAEDEETQNLLIASEEELNGTGEAYTNRKHPYRWGTAPETSSFSGISMRYNGNWTKIGSGDDEWVWRLKVTSPGAISQQLIFSTLWLPAGSELWVYSQESEETMACGADCHLFTAGDTRIDEKFTTPIVHGSDLYLEYHMKLPVVRRDTIVPRVHIFKVVQGYRDVLREAPGDRDAPVAAKGLDEIYNQGLSQSCNNDATCPLVGDEWEKARRSVVQIITDGGSNGNQFSAVCTGTLINNPGKRNYVITAYHCLEGESVSNWAFVFNYEKECDRQSFQNSKFSDFLNGARLVWADKATDTILLEIYQDIPSRYNAYFSGWDARSFDLLDPFTVSFHHPNGDFKKVSVDTNAKAEGTCPFCGNLRKSHIVVTGWDDGTTERGSSGCSLFNSDQSIVGVLSGGSASCPDNSGFDLFGKMEVAYEHGLVEHIANPGQLSMGGRWNADPRSALAFEPETLVVVEGGPEASLDVWLNAPVDQGDLVTVSVNLSEGDDKWVEVLHPRELTFDSSDWSEAKQITIKPRDNADFDGDVKYYVRLHARHKSGKDAYISDFPVVQQDDEHITGDTLFDPIEINDLPFSFMGDTGMGYTNTLQSRCELGSASPDIVFEYTPRRDTHMSVSLCALPMFDSTLYILENGRERWCNDDGEDSCGESAQLNNVVFKRDHTYHIVVDGYNGARGRFQLDVRELPQFVNSFSAAGADGASPIPMDTYVPADTYTKADTQGSDAQGSGVALSAAGMLPIASLAGNKAPESDSYVTGGFRSQQDILRSGREHVSAVTRFFSTLESSQKEKEAARQDSFSLTTTRNVLDLLALLAAVILYF
ncbi:peptidase S1 domain-containing protein [Chloropicon primus]|uniref:Peptidase S1 domain-containing protein n=2 Tax=Chloropicon primus TaxID=1764295 RepID=A0A5B8MQD4_9CHLO|nr:hypothetical protein A3770_06p41180 [Chloropicon primus]UPR00811.1 peptidase S1 domain-containing protein [Chloropicon primus]|eukprot:QDZ21600.1 hypothetical protein A3770_06p41180 [Chloropicon primus]